MKTPRALSSCIAQKKVKDDNGAGFTHWIDRDNCDPSVLGNLHRDLGKIAEDPREVIRGPSDKERGDSYPWDERSRAHGV